MKKRINTGFMLIAAIAIVVTAVCSMFLFYQILEEQIFDDLKGTFIDNIGFVDGKLHIVTKSTNQRNNVSPSLVHKISQKNKVKSTIDSIYNIFQSTSSEEDSYGFLYLVICCG